MVLKERKRVERITKGLSSSSNLHPQNPPRQQSAPNAELSMPSSATAIRTTMGRSIIGGKAVASSSKDKATKSSDKGDEKARGDSHTVDSAFWPPSFYADPMKLGGKVPFAALAFGKSRRNKSSVVGTGQKPTIRNSTPQRPITAPPVFQSNVELENDGEAWTVMEKHWKRQLMTLRETFDGIRSALFQPPSKKQRQDPFSALDDDIVAHSFSASILESVICDLSSVLDRVGEVEGAFRDPLFIEEVNKDDEFLQQNDDDDDDEAMAFLICTEVLDTTAESGMPMGVPVDLDEEEPLWCHEELAVDDNRDEEHWIGEYTPQKELSVNDKVNEEEDADVASLLECTEALGERLPTSDEKYTASKHDGASHREQAVQVAQDVVLIQELTRLVRQKTLELTRIRMASASK
jgi:hypothetical protein